MGNIFGKATMSIKFQEPKQSFKAGEQINLVMEYQSDQVFKDAEIVVVFKDDQNVFEVKKILSVNRWNNKESINKTHEIKFDIASPTDVTLSQNGVYSVEAKLKVLGHLWKSTKAKASINIPLAAN